MTQYMHPHVKEVNPFLPDDVMSHHQNISLTTDDVLLRHGLSMYIPILHS